MSLFEIIATTFDAASTQGSQHEEIDVGSDQDEIWIYTKGIFQKGSGKPTVRPHAKGAVSAKR